MGSHLADNALFDSLSNSWWSQNGCFNMLRWFINPGFTLSSRKGSSFLDGNDAESESRLFPVRTKPEKGLLPKREGEEP